MWERGVSMAFAAADGFGSPTEAPTSNGERKPFSPPQGTWDEILATLQVNVALCLLLLLLFECKRAKRSVYAPRLRCVANDRAPDGGRPPPRRPLGWAAAARGVGQDELRHMVGLDAFMTLRFLAYCRTVFCVAAFVGLAVLVPTYGSGHKGKGGFNRYTLGNCRSASNRLWAPVAFAYFFTAVALAALEKESMAYLEFRLEFLRRGSDAAGAQPRCSVLVERVPRDLRSAGALARFFRDLFGDAAVHSAVSYLDLQALEHMLRDRDRARDALEACALRRGDGGGGGGCLKLCAPRGRRVQGAYARIDGARDADDAALAAAVDSLDAGQAALSQLQAEARAASDDAERRAAALAAESAQRPAARLNPARGRPAAAQRLDAVMHDIGDTTIGAVQSGAKRVGALLGVRNCVRRAKQRWLSRAAKDARRAAAGCASSTGVVTFASPGLAAEAAQLKLTARPGGLVAQLAPAATDLVFANVHLSQADIDARTLAANAALCVLAVCWAPLIALCQAVSNLREVARVVPALRPFVEDPEYAYSRSVVTGYLPVLLALGLLSLLPAVFSALARAYVGVKTESRVQQFVLSRYFYFQILQIFVTVASGSLAVVLEDFIKRPGSLVELLGASLPALSAYFGQLLIVKVFFSVAFELARPLGLLRVFLRTSYKAHANLTKRQKRRLKAPPALDYGSVLPEFLMVLLVGAIYAPIAPLIIPLAFAFFAAAELVYKHNVLYVYVPTCEHGAAQLWPEMTWFVSLSLIVAQLTLIGHLAILQGAKQSPALMPLPLLTFAAYRNLRANYEEPARHLDKESAVRGNLYDASRAADAPAPLDGGPSTIALDGRGDDGDDGDSGDDGDDGDSGDDDGVAAADAVLSADYYGQPALVAKPVFVDAQLRAAAAGTLAPRRPAPAPPEDRA